LTSNVSRVSDHFKVIISIQERLARSEGALALSFSSTLELHASFIATVAFRPKDHPVPTWIEARNTAQQVLSVFFRSDGRDLVESMLGLAVIANEERKRLRLVRLAKKGQGLAPPSPTLVKHLHHASVHSQLWSKAYDALLPSDPAGAGMIMNAVATFSHVERMDRERSWDNKDILGVVKSDDWVTAIRAINTGLQATRESFARSIEALGMHMTPATAGSLWDQAGIPKSAITLLLSPVEDIHDPMISLIQQSFEDVDDRGDCFRVILARYPAEAMDGLSGFLSSFIETAKITPESCSLAKWLVRCFTDVLDALCRPSDAAEPLLQSPKFLESFKDGKAMSRRVTDLWHLMTTSLAVIFRKTQAWAPLYDNETMVDWMRDALIFGRQMTEHIKAFEGAALGRVGANFGSTGDVEGGSLGESPAKSSTTVKELVQKLQIVLADLVSWLRLTE
jgi:senataxin